MRVHFARFNSYYIPDYFHERNKYEERTTIMKRILITFIAMFSSQSLQAQAPQESVVFGTWVNESHMAAMDIESCENGSLCGTISWLNPEADELLDVKNPDISLRSNPLVGTEMLWGFKKKNDRWVGGRIYNPREGRTYKSKLSLTERDKLQIKGCVGPICKTQYWTRFKIPNQKHEAGLP